MKEKIGDLRRILDLRGRQEHPTYTLIAPKTGSIQSRIRQHDKPSPISTSYNTINTSV